MNGRYFPWRLYWKLFWTLIVLINILFVFNFTISSYFYDFEFDSDHVYLLIFCFFVLSVLGSAWFAYRFVVPFRNVILKALRIANKKYVSDFDEDDVLIDQPGEYVELEYALDKIRRKLKKRRWQLSHEREESQALMISMDEAIVSVDLEQRIIFFNSQFGAQFLSQELVASRPDGARVPLTQCFREPEVLELFSNAFHSGIAQGKQILLFTKLDTQPKYFSVRVSPLREEDSKQIYGALAVFHDITEIKNAEQIRIEFVENASHELRTPLTAVKGFVETIKSDVQDGNLEQVPQFLQIVSRNVDRLVELVNDMLTISSLESNSNLKLEVVHPLVVTEEVVSRLSKLALEKRILIKSHSEISEVKLDPSKLEQVLTNLLGNAIKYLPDNGAIEVNWKSGMQDQVVLSVKDNGPGIALEHQSRLFERFYRIDKGRSRDVGGTGLGLSIVKHIMQSHGGSVSIESSAGRGAEFICVFPRRS